MMMDEMVSMQQQSSSNVVVVKQSAGVVPAVVARPVHYQPDAGQAAHTTTIQ